MGFPNKLSASMELKLEIYPLNYNSYIVNGLVFELNKAKDADVQ